MTGSDTSPGEPAGHRLYGDLAGWWPLISPPEEYTDDADEAAAAFGTAGRPVREVLELGSGGGHTACHLKARHTMTLVDLSPDMLAVSRRLNPECAHHQGDMRTVRLGRDFDAVFVHDAIDYMTGAADLERVLATAYAHCRPGGVVVLVPDHTAETFAERTEHGGADGPDGRGARYLGWTWDPDPADTWIRTEYAFLLRDADGTVQVARETHRTGLFGRTVWLRLLTAAGFDARTVTERNPGDWVPRELFVGHRPRG